MSGKLLARQYKRALGVLDEDAQAVLIAQLAAGQLPADFAAGLARFFSMVDEAYG